MDEPDARPTTPDDDTEIAGDEYRTEAPRPAANATNTDTAAPESSVPACG